MKRKFALDDEVDSRRNSLEDSKTRRYLDNIENDAHEEQLEILATERARLEEIQKNLAKERSQIAWQQAKHAQIIADKNALLHSANELMQKKNELLIKKLEQKELIDKLDAAHEQSHVKKNVIDPNLMSLDPKVEESHKNHKDVPPTHVVLEVGRPEALQFQQTVL